MRNFQSCTHMCSECSADMICLEAQYFNLNKILLQSIALWPFQQSKLVRFQFIVILTILITAIISQVKNNIYYYYIIIIFILLLSRDTISL